MTDRERAALAVVREGGFPRAGWSGVHHRTLRLSHDCVLSAYDGAGEVYSLYPDLGCFTPKVLRAVLRALDILNGVGDE